MHFFYSIILSCAHGINLNWFQRYGRQSDASDETVASQKTEHNGIFDACGQ